MPCQCGGEQGCYKIAQSVSKFLKIFPLNNSGIPVIDLSVWPENRSYEFGWATTTLLPEQAAACSNDRHSQKSLQRDGPSWSDDHGSEEVDALQHLEHNAACVSQCAVLFQKLHPSIIETSQTKEFKHDHHIANRESKVIYHLLARQGTSITDKCVPNK